MLSAKTVRTPLIILLVVATALAACAPPATQVVRETQIVRETVVVPEQVEVVVTATPEPFKPEGTLTIGLTTNVAAIELPYAPERQSGNAAQTMYDSLVFPEADGTFTPALAERWETSDDGREFTFFLRQDVTFHNGEPFNADAVLFSWETYTQPDVTYPWTETADRVEKVDDYTVKIINDEPNALLLANVAGWAMIPPGYYAEVGPQGFAEHPVGTGPFVFEAWVKGDHLTVVANPDYWREGYPKLERIVFKFMPESATRVAAIQAGEIDIAPRLSAEEAQSLLGAPGIQIVRYPVNRIYYVAFNNLTTGKGTPVEDARVRQAIAHAVDVEAIIDALFDGYATRAVGLVAPGDLGYDPSDPIAYDPERARQLLAEAGHAGGLQLDMACPDGAYPHINEVCQAVRGYLDEVGVTGDLSIMESNAYWDLEANKELPPLFVDSWSNASTESYFRLSGALQEGATYANWFDADLDSMIRQLLVTADTEERAELYRQIQQAMRDDPPFVYLYLPEAFEAVSTRVQNYQPRPAENYFLWDVRLTAEQ